MQPNILSIPFDRLTLREALEQFASFLTGGSNHVVVTPNPEAVMRARRDPDFRAALLAADLRLPDGIGIVWASRILRQPVPAKLGGCDTALTFFEEQSRTRETGGTALSVYLLGAAPGAAEAAAARLTARFPGLQAAGWHDGYFDAAEEKNILREIRALRPDVLLLGMGMPRQELWAVAHRDLPVRLTLCLGGTIDVLAGKKKRPPRFMCAIGLEWLGYLLMEPKRFKRYLELPRFAGAVLKEKLRGRLS